jgi:hypothetical protein
MEESARGREGVTYYVSSLIMRESREKGFTR